MYGSGGHLNGFLPGEEATSMKKFRRVLIASVLAAAMFVMTACGQAEAVADSAKVDDSAVTRSFDEEPDEHYIDDDAIALAGKSSSSAGAAMAQSAYAALNAYRQQKGLGGLVWNGQLAKDAMVRAQECVTSFSHTRPNGTQWWTVDSANMYGENLAYNYNDANSVTAAWVASPTHLANMVSGEYTMVGISAYQAANGVWYWAEEFG